MTVDRRRWVFAHFELDAASGTLWHAGSRVAIDAKPLGVLAELIRRRERAVSRDELRESVWRGVVVSDAAIASAVRDLRRALGDTGSGQRFVRTVRNQGFRFVAEVEEREIGPPADAFVGRDAVLRRMEGGLAGVGSCAGRWIWLEGEPGIGKTRALVELVTRLERVGVEVCVGSCLEEPGAAPYRPWQQVVRRLVGRESPEALAARFGPLAVEALRLLPEAGRSGAGRALAGREEDGRLLLFEAVAELLRGAARSGPLVLALDDLHRADAPTAKLLQHLLGDLPQLPLLVVAAYRPQEVDADHPISPALALSQPGVERLALRGLDAADAGRLAGAVLGRPLAPAAEEALLRRTRGNPFFVREIAQAVGEREGGPDTDLRTIEEGVPSGIAQVVQGRIRRLREQCVTALECAAVIGRVFDLDVLRAVLEDERVGDFPSDVLDPALGAGVVEPVAEVPGQLRFAHILVRDGVYGLIPPSRRMSLHGRVGRAIERLRADADGDLAAGLAHHYGEAAAPGDAGRAFVYARRAGENALACSAWEEAEHFFEGALRALDLGGVDNTAALRAACLLGLGRARWRGGAPEAARACFERAAALAERAADADTLADAALGYAGRTDAEPSMNPAAVALLERALAALPEADSARRCEVIARLGTEFYHGDMQRCDALTERAVAMAERLGDRDTLAYALSARGFALLRPDVAPARRIALYDRQMALVDGVGEVAALGLQEKLFALLEQGDLLRFDDGLRAFRRLAAELRQPFFGWMAGVYEGARLFLSGRIEDALGHAQETFALGTEIGTPNAFPVFSVQLTYLRREQGRMAELEPALRQILASDAAYPALRSGLVPMLLERGRTQEARDLFQQILARNLDDVPRDQHWIPMLAVLASACTQLRDAQRARRLYEGLAPYSGRFVVVGHGAVCDGAVDHHLARLASTADDPDLADEHFAAAVELERRAGARLSAAHSQRCWAGVLWKSGAPHERERARELVAEATATYRELGLEVPAGEVPLP